MLRVEQWKGILPDQVIEGRLISSYNVSGERVVFVSPITIGQIVGGLLSGRDGDPSYDRESLRTIAVR
jgi:hypothetical protein